MEEIKKKQDKSFELLKKNFNYKNKMSAPKLVKVVLSSGTGSGLKRDKKINEVVFDRLTKITGQKPSLRKAKNQLLNLTIGIKEHIIFPETSDEELKDVFGSAITLVSTAKNKKEATAFFELIGIP